MALNRKHIGKSVPNNYRPNTKQGPNKFLKHSEAIHNERQTSPQQVTTQVQKQVPKHFQTRVKTRSESVQHGVAIKLRNSSKSVSNQLQNNS